MKKTILLTCSLTLVLAACKKDDDTPTPNNDPGPSQPVGAFGLTLASTPSIVAVQTDDTAYFDASEGWYTESGSSDLNGNHLISARLAYDLANSWMITFSVPGDSVPPIALFQSAFHLGAHNYTVNNEAPSVMIGFGVTGSWMSTQCNGGAQDGSSFNIIDRQFVAGSPDTMKVLATFHCDLHDCIVDFTAEDLHGAIRLNFLRE
jgi:hypothetical protein